MKTPGWKRWVARTVLVTFSTCFVACGGPQGEASSTTTVTAAPLPPSTVPATLPPPSPTLPPAPPPLPAQPPEQLSKEQLRDLVAPVALYPDVVLSSLLPATTFPEQIRDAAGWVGNAQQVDRIPDDRGWDGSIVGLLQFPDVVRWLDDNPAWTDEMGQAVTYQQGDVLDAIQDYRRMVRDAGNLKSNEYQKVTYVQDQDIRIEPARPDVVYVPSYDPVLATQPQPATASPGVNPWIAFGGGVLVGALGAWALYSIFDDDDEEHNYYRGGGRRRIRGYDNYYYQRGRRPRRVEWQPRERMRKRVDRIETPKRLQHTSAAGQPARKGAALRAPSTRPTAQRPREVRREQRQERREIKQDTRQQRQMQQKEQRQQRQTQQKEQRQQRQEKKQEQRLDQRQQRQERQGERRELKKENRQERQMQRQDGRQERQGTRAQRQETRQERRQVSRDAGSGQQKKNQNQGGKKKKQQEQQQN